MDEAVTVAVVAGAVTLVQLLKKRGVEGVWAASIVAALSFAGGAGYYLLPDVYKPGVQGALLAGAAATAFVLSVSGLVSWYKAMDKQGE